MALVSSLNKINSETATTGLVRSPSQNFVCRFVTSLAVLHHPGLFLLCGAKQQRLPVQCFYVTVASQYVEALRR